MDKLQYNKVQIIAGVASGLSEYSIIAGIKCEFSQLKDYPTIRVKLFTEDGKELCGAALSRPYESADLVVDMLVKALRSEFERHPEAI